MTQPDDRAFDKVEPDSLLSYDCSPELRGDLGFRGIRLQAPRRVLFGPPTRDPPGGPRGRVLVCGAHHLDSSYLGLREWFLPAILLVAADARSHRVYSGKLDLLAQALDRPGDVLTDADLKGRSVIEFWNPDLTRLLSLPEGEADYLVHATVGDHVSNVVRIEVRSLDTEDAR